MTIKSSLKPLYFVVFLILACRAVAVAQEDPTKKLGMLLGKWQSQGTFANGNQVTSSLDCRWSAQSDFLICEQAIKMTEGEHHQLTVYSFNKKDQNYSYTTLGDPGARPTSGSIQIAGDVWTYSSGFERDGKTVQIRTTNDFSTPGIEVFKVELSDDGGATWKNQLQGNAHKMGS